MIDHQEWIGYLQGENMFFICKALFVGVGFACIAISVAHESIWWKRRKWRRGQGIIVGFTESSDSDGVMYGPEIQFEGPNGIARFTGSGTSKKPRVGGMVDIVIDETGNSGELLGIGNRWLGTLIPIPMGAMFLFTGFGMTLLKEDAGTDKPAANVSSSRQAGHD